MTHEIEMRKDGILRIAFIGDVDDKDMEAYNEDLVPYIEAATPEKPLLTLADSARSGKFSSAARKSFLSQNNDPRIGKAAVIGASRYTRVLASFVLKATGRGNVRFFDSEEQAVAWLKS